MVQAGGVWKEEHSWCWLFQAWGYELNCFDRNEGEGVSHSDLRRSGNHAVVEDARDRVIHEYYEDVLNSPSSLS